MKLLQEHAEQPHHLPDAAPSVRSGILEFLSRRFVARACSTAGSTIAIGLALTLLLSLLLGLSYLDVSRSIDKNGISLKDVYAESRLEVIDQEATRRKIDRATQTLAMIYQNPAPHNQDITNNLAKLLSSLEALTANRALPDYQRYRHFARLSGAHPDTDLIYNRYFKLGAAPLGWNQLGLAASQTMRRILKHGLSELDNQQHRIAIIRNAMAQAGHPPSEGSLVYFLVDVALEPNLIIDTPRMEAAQNRIARKTEPITHIYRQFEKIVDRGQQVSALQMAALQQMGKGVAQNSWQAVLGIVALCALFVLTVWMYLYALEGQRFFKPSYAGLMALLTTVTVMLFELFEQNTLGTLPIFCLPMATFGLTLSIFIHPRLAVFAASMLTFLIGLTLRIDFYSLCVLLFGSFTGIYVMGKRVATADRSQPMVAGLYVGAAQVLVLAVISTLHPFLTPEPGQLASLLGWAFFGGMLAGMLTIGGLYLLESLFRLVTPYTLMELANHNKPLLKRMQFEAPGTFHHSLMVASMAEAAAESIGADPLLTRVGCLYHDIGKMKRPLFFIENQSYFGSDNPHDKLSPRLSKMVITAHPRDSVEMARQHHLPEVLMKFMTEHHGTLTAGYFYNKACQEEGGDNVNKSQFRYPGPKPSIKETAIVMLADACESAVRALKTPTVGQIEDRIDKIIAQRVEDGQFDECPITFGDINLIKETFVRVLRGIQHTRIEYQQTMLRELGRRAGDPQNVEASLRSISDLSRGS